MIRSKINSAHFTSLLIALFICCTNYGQVKNIGLPDIHNYKKNEYRGGTQNWNIDQDKNGTLYFANNNGLLQFNGSEWNLHFLPNRSAIRSLKVSSSGKIFVGGYNEFGYYQPNKKGKLEYFSLSKLVNENSVNLIDFIWKIHLFKGSVVFQSFGRAYIYSNNKLRVLEAPNRFQFSFLVEDKLYFQDIGLGLMEFKDDELVQMPGTTSVNNTEIWGMFTISPTELLIATLDKGLFIYDGSTMTPWQTEANSFILKNSSLGGVMIKDKFTVLNSVLDGIIVCDISGKIIQHVNRKKGMQNNTVLSSFIDSQNNLWLGLDNGITFINENSPFTYFGVSYELSTVYASLVHNGYLYVATNQGVFYHVWNDDFREDTFKLVEGTTGQAWNIQVIDGELICGHNRGALSLSDGKVKKVIDGNGYFGFKQVPDRPGFMIGSKYNGFSLFEKKSDGWQFKAQIEGFDKSSSTYELDGQYLWLKKDNLLYQTSLSLDLSKFKSIKTYKSISSSLKGIGTIQKVFGNVYFQTDNRFFRYSQREDAFYEDKNVSKLFKDIPKIRALTEDKAGNIWYVFNESLGVLEKRNGGKFVNKIAQFSNLTGNLVYEYLSINSINKQNIFIGMTDGLAHYNPSFMNDFVKQPKAFIQSFSYASDTLFLGNMRRYDGYKVPFAFNNVRFSFSSPTYENLNNVEYSYRLEGFDNNWSNWSTMSVKEYTNLKEGNYVMNVKVRNSYGIQSKPSSVSFTVSPPFYRHFLAYVIYIVLILASIYFIRQRIRMKIRKNKYYETIEQRRLYLEKESKIRQEQYELEKEIEKLKNDKLQFKILSKDKELVNNSLQVVKKNKILNGIIHKLKDIDIESVDESTKVQITKLNRSITKEVNTDKSWKDLEKHIKNVHFDFLKRLKEKYPTISPRELDLSTYLLMNMSTKEIAEIMNISNGGVELARYRLRKKLGLNKKENLTGFLMSI